MPVTAVVFRVAGPDWGSDDWALLRAIDLFRGCPAPRWWEAVRRPTPATGRPGAALAPLPRPAVRRTAPACAGCSHHRSTSARPRSMSTAAAPAVGVITLPGHRA